MKKLTKIVATISDQRCEIEFIKNLFEAGINVVRLNTAHLSKEGAAKIIENTRKVSNKIGILIDTKGPEIRTTATDQNFELKKGETIIFKGNPDGISSKECIYSSYQGIVNDVSVGKIILIDDGEIAFKVIDKDSEKLTCRVENDGIIKSRKSINIPDVLINLPSISDKDFDFIDFAIENEVTFIAHSFVRNKQDVIALKEILQAKKSDVKIIAKIENQQGVDNIDEILDHVYGIMIARGDLGIEIPAERIPAIQKSLNKKCIRRRKPVIVATQMLHTMIENPRPTRAEISDVANAIYDGTDAIMLSGETAYGEYPVEAVQTMTKVAEEVERYKREHEEFIELPHNDKITKFLAHSAVKASVELDVAAIIADSISGSTIRNLAAFRSSKPIFAMCYTEKVMRELALSYGVYVENIEQRNSTEEFFNSSVSLLINKKLLEIDDLVVVLAGNFGSGVGATFIEISTADHLVKRY
jgi:pyruvate kinase